MFNANRTIRVEDASGHGVGGNLKVAVGEYTLSAALTLNQVIPMVAVPTGARIVDVILSTTDLDTGTPAITLDVGDGDTADRFIAASNVGQAGGLARLATHGGHGYKYAAADTVDVKVKAAPGTGATSGTIRLSVQYVLD